MITLNTVYFIAGLLFAAFAIFNLRDNSNPKRYVNALFWGIYALTFLAGTELPHFVTGLMAILLAVIAGTGQLGKGKPMPISLKSWPGAKPMPNASATGCLSLPC